MKTLQEIKRFYEVEMSEEVGRLEGMRRKFIFVLIVVFALALFVSGLSAFYFNSGGDEVYACFFVIVISLLFIYVSYYILRKLYMKGYASVIANVFQYIDNSLDFASKACVSKQLIEKSQLISRKFNGHRGGNLIKGYIDNIKIQSSYLKISRRYGNGSIALCEGIFFAAELKEELRSRTFIFSRLSLESDTTTLGKIINPRLNKRPPEIPISNKVFNDLYLVLGDDSSVIRKILSREFIAKINEYSEQNNQDFLISFLGRRMYVAQIFGGNLLEPKLLKSVENFDYLESYFEDIIFLVGLSKDINSYLKQSVV